MGFAWSEEILEWKLSTAFILGCLHLPGVSTPSRLFDRLNYADPLTPFSRGGPGRTINKDAVQNFVREFIKAYQGHGGRVENKAPPIIEGPQDPAKAVEMAFTRVGQACNKRPQMLIFILSDKTAFHYARIKKSADCRYGVVSQCESAHPDFQMIY